MKHSQANRIICVLLSLLFAFSVCVTTVFADETTEKTTVKTTARTTTEKATEKTTEKRTEKLTKNKKETTTEDIKKQKQKAKKSLDQQKKELQEKLKKSQDKLEQFGENAKTTEEYIKVLDEKIGIVGRQLDVLTEEVAEARGKVEKLNKQIKPLEKKLRSLQKEYDKSQEEYIKLKGAFTRTYGLYCLRLRAMYISGSDSAIASLLCSKDLEQFLSRYEMILAVSESDTQLLKKVDTQMDAIITKQGGLNEQKKRINASKTVLDKKRNECKKEQKKVEDNQELIAKKKIMLDDDRAESDRLYAVYTRNAKVYTEFHNEDEKKIKKVDAEIDALLKGLKDPDEITTAVTENRASREKKMEDDAKSLYNKSDVSLAMTFPVPGHYAVSCAYGYYSNGKPHTGTDFPCPTGSKVVAAQKGMIIKVRKLNYSYGYYVMVYHGTDSKGRQIVTLYAHNSEILVTVGQNVAKGQQIARSGSTGNSTGPHSHFEVIVDGVKVNPVPYLSKK
ncbi:MAG: peptidoglycan DD-metalloendopeptidase family protein [Eubacterium sp.]|nr:peptidoglycan DD-metalloendopeptidase family protein [Eubacterium sp.]